MNKADTKLLGRLFAAEIEDRLPAQIKSKRLIGLEKEGLVKRMEVTLPGRFPVRLEGWQLTLIGHLIYCSECAGQEEPE